MTEYASSGRGGLRPLGVDFGVAGLRMGCLGVTSSLEALGMKLGVLGVDLVALEVDRMPWKWMRNWYRVGVDLSALKADLDALGMVPGALGTGSNHLGMDLGLL